MGRIANRFIGDRSKEDRVKRVFLVNSSSDSYNIGRSEALERKDRITTSRFNGGGVKKKANQKLKRFRNYFASFKNGRFNKSEISNRFQQKFADSYNNQYYHWKKPAHSQKDKEKSRLFWRYRSFSKSREESGTTHSSIRPPSGSSSTSRERTCSEPSTKSLSRSQRRSRPKSCQKLRWHPRPKFQARASPVKKDRLRPTNIDRYREPLKAGAKSKFLGSLPFYGIIIQIALTIIKLFVIGFSLEVCTLLYNQCFMTEYILVNLVP